jgi:NADH-quinone oxidoreductase subunit L
VLLGVFVTSFYSFRLLYLTFHGPERFRDAHADDGAHDHEHGEPDAHGETHHEPDVSAHDDHGHHGPHEPHESPWVVTVPLILLAIPSILIGFLTVGPMLAGDFFRGAIEVLPQHDAMAAWAEEFHGPVAFAIHGLTAPAFWLAFAGFALATFVYLFRPSLAAKARKAFALPIRILENKYGFDDLWIKGFAAGGVKLGRWSWKKGDAGLIDGILVDGTALVVDRVAGVVRRIQNGRLYNYAFAMILGLIVLLAVLVKMTAGA